MLCIGIVAGSVMFSLSKDPKKAYFGRWRTYSVLTPSMTQLKDSPYKDGFNKGDMIITEGVPDPTKLAVGDVITFNPAPARDETSTVYLTHRIIGIKDEIAGIKGLYFITKGDANPSADPPIMSSQVIGKKVFVIPKIGIVLENLRPDKETGKHSRWFYATISLLISLFGCIFMFRWYFSKPKPKGEGTEQKQGGKRRKPEPEGYEEFDYGPQMRTTALPERGGLYINQT
ncbi:MAG: signal peptidase I [Oscillospiraceae bacterium]|nr:signal peptidase I [Oscillospiraceae bacterium]